MKEKILALLVAKFAGVRKDGLARLANALSLQAADETEAGALVEKLTPEKVNEFVSDYRKDVDKEVSEANKTYEGTLKKKFDFVEKKEPDPNKDPDPNKATDTNDIATIVANAVKTAVEPLQQKLSAFEGQKVNETRLQQLQSKLSVFPEGNKIGEQFKAQKLKDFGFMNFENDEKFAEYLTGLDTDITGLNQEIADIGLSGHGRPLMGGQNKDGISSAVAAYVDDKTKPDANLEGKKL
jgi:hypothetical protein